MEAAAASAAPFEQASGGSAADGSGEEPAASAAAEVSVDAGVEGGAEAVRVETAAAPAEGVAAVKSDRQWIVGRSGDEAEASMMEVLCPKALRQHTKKPHIFGKKLQM